MPGRGVLNRQIGILSLKKLTNDEKLIFTLFYWKNRKIGYPGAYARATVCVKNSRPTFKVWISALLAGVAPTIAYNEFWEIRVAYRGSLSIEKISIWVRLGETRTGTFHPGPPNKCSIFPFLQYNYIIIFLKNQIGGHKTAPFFILSYKQSTENGSQEFPSHHNSDTVPKGEHKSATEHWGE